MARSTKTQNTSQGVNPNGPRNVNKTNRTGTGRRGGPESTAGTGGKKGGARVTMNKGSGNK